MQVATFKQASQSAETAPLSCSIPRADHENIQCMQLCTHLAIIISLRMPAGSLVAGGRIVEDKVPARSLQRPHHAAIVACPLLDRLQQCRVSISCGRQHDRRDVQPPERWDSGVRPQLLQGRSPAHSGTPGMQEATQPITEAADSGGGQFLEVPLPQGAPLQSEFCTTCRARSHRFAA